MRRHDRIQRALVEQRLENRHVVTTQRLQIARVARRLFVRVGADRAVAGKMLAGGFHARFMHAGDKAARHRQRNLRILMEGAVADRRADMAEVQHRREADVDIHGDHLRRHLPPCLLRQLAATLRIVQRRERLHCGQRGEAVAEALDASALLIDRYHQPRARRAADLAHQFSQLRRIVVVAREKDHAADGRMPQDLALFGVQFKTFDIQHQRAGKLCRHNQFLARRSRRAN